jgi:hypothetical protein
LTASDLEYPVVLVRDDALEPTSIHRLDEVISRLGISEDVSGMIAEKAFSKTSNLDLLESISNKDLREQFLERFSNLNDMFESQPQIRLILPDNRSADARLENGPDESAFE